MMSLNRVFISGNLARDPEIRQIPSGASVCNLGVAVTERFEKQGGEKVEKTVFVDIAIWEQQGQWCGENLRKGDRVAVEGALQQDAWTDDKGQKRTKIKIRADRVHFLGHPSKRGESDSPATGGVRQDTPVPPAPAPQRTSRPQGNPPSRRPPVEDSFEA
jgi:single-strand DNA-binding protein